METIVDKAREHRNSGAVLKYRLSIVRSRNPTAIILIFEGDTDIGPYEAWISRIDDDLSYQPLAGTGKAQVLDLRRRISKQDELARLVYFFVDRDFDDLRGHQPGTDIYCTDCYSIENYLVSEKVLSSLLNDELRCDPTTEDKTRTLACFNEVFEQFLSAVRAANGRLYRAKRLGLKGGSVSDSINDFVTIELYAVHPKESDASLMRCVPLDREPTTAECEEIDRDFQQLAGAERYRGKLNLAFFMRWLDLLGAERKRSTCGLFSESRNTGFSIANITMRSLASRSAIPESLHAFISRISAEAESATNMT